MEVIFGLACSLNVTPTKQELAELKEYGGEAWMLEYTRLNPEYTGWGPGCDYMYSIPNNPFQGWSDSIEYASWEEFGPWNLDDLNECVNFHFDLREGLDLVLWFLHPRKGASRGVRLKGLSKEDAKAAREWLKGAAQRNAERFGKL